MFRFTDVTGAIEYRPLLGRYTYYIPRC